MAVSNSNSNSKSGRMSEFHVSRAIRDSSDIISPERNIVWSEKPNDHHHHHHHHLLHRRRLVPVVYYLSRNGHLEHPHFMEVPLSSSSSHSGLFLRDVIWRLDVLRGKGMAALYSWSCKRSYKNGFVWQDLSEDDFIYPVHGRDYVLKGSLLPSPPPPPETIQISSSSGTGDFEYRSRRRNQSCSSIDFPGGGVVLEEYSVYKTSDRSTPAADASTQTDDVRRRRRRPPQPEVKSKSEEEEPEPQTQRDEIEISAVSISPPPSDSSPETLEKLMKAEGRPIILTGDVTATNGGKIQKAQSATNGGSGGRSSSVLMQLITCGSISFKDCGAGPSLMSQYRMRAPSCRGGGGGVKLEEKEYFSGSLVETKKEEMQMPAAALKRSNSYNADVHR